jgi:hypothetical protein
MRFTQSRSLFPALLASFICVVSLTLAVWGGKRPSSSKADGKAVGQAAGVAAPTVTLPAANGIAQGSWGGNTIGLKVTPKGTSFIMDCAVAQVLQPIVPNAQGEFSVPGQVREEGRGPARPATFQGTIAGDQMQIAVFFRDSNGQIENWQDELTFGHDGPKAPDCQLTA